MLSINSFPKTCKSVNSDSDPDLDLLLQTFSQLIAETIKKKQSQVAILNTAMKRAAN